MARPGGMDRGLYERVKGSNVWWVCWFDSDGKKHREKAGTKSAARVLYQKRKTGALEGRKLPELNRREHKLSDVVERYKAEIEANKKSAAWDARIACLWVNEIGSVSIGNIQSGDIEKIKARWLEKLQPATVNRRLAYLKTLLNKAVRDGILERNPVAAGRVKMLRENAAPKEILYPDQEVLVRKFLSRADNLAMTIALHTGLRISEQLGVKRKEVDLRQAGVEVTDAKGGGRQQVRLNRQALEAYEEILASHTSEWTFPGASASASMSRRTLSKHFEKACGAAGLTGFSWHCLRHTYISRLVMLGVDIVTVQHLARHKSIQMTLRYAKLAPDHKKYALDRLAESYPARTDCQEAPKEEQ